AGDLLGVLLLGGQVVDRDVGTLPREGDRDGSSDARVASRDERPPPLEPAGAAVGVLTDVRLRGAVRLQARFLLLLLGRGDPRVAGARVVEGGLAGAGGAGRGAAQGAAPGG